MSLGVGFYNVETVGHSHAFQRLLAVVENAVGVGVHEHSAGIVGTCGKSCQKQRGDGRRPQKLFGKTHNDWFGVKMKFDAK